MQEEKILATKICLVIIDQCQLLIKNTKLQNILKIIKPAQNSLFRIVGLAVPLFNLTEEPGRLSLEIERLETTFQCNVETTSDILSILRYIIQINYNILDIYSLEIFKYFI